MESKIQNGKSEIEKGHQENNMLLELLEVLESAGLTGVTRTSFIFL